MRRRCVLASVSAVLVAGCVGSGGGSGTTTKGDGTTTEGAPSVASSSLAVTDTGCGSQSDGGASVAFERREVVVSGTVVGNDGCYRARLGDVSFDGSSDVCRVVVEAFDDSGPDEVCTDCITAISYEATVVFDGGLPGTVEVVHDDLGGENTVVTEDS